MARYGLVGSASHTSRPSPPTIRPSRNQPLEWTGPAERSLRFASVVGAGPAIQRRSVRWHVTLREVLERIDTFPRDASVYMANATDLEATALVHQAEDDDPPARMDGMPLVMDVWHVKETLDGLRSLLRQQTGEAPTQAQLFDRYLVYLKNDA